MRMPGVAVVLGLVLVLAGVGGCGDQEKGSVSYTKPCELLKTDEVQKASGVTVVSKDFTDTNPDGRDTHECRWQDPKLPPEAFVLRLKVRPDKTLCGAATDGQTTTLPELGDGGYVTLRLDNTSIEVGAVRDKYCMRGFASQQPADTTTPMPDGDTTPAELQDLVKTALNRLAE